VEGGILPPGKSGVISTTGEIRFLFPPPRNLLKTSKQKKLKMSHKIS
jgi:hypothetical protein